MTEAKALPMAKSKSTLKTVQELISMFIGVCAYTIGWTAFILSQDITSGGLAGITTVIQIATSIPATIPYYIINGGLLVLALVFLGTRFTIRTIIGVGMLFITIPIGQALFTDPVQQHAVYENIWPWLREIVPNVGPLLVSDEPFVALLMGSILCGLGLGFVFSVNGSTGGTDVIVAIINKYKNISLGRAMIIVDAIIVSTGCVVSHYMGPQYSWTVALGKLAFSVVEIVVCAQTMDFFLNSNKQSVQLFINSLKADQIAYAITHQLHRGCTIFNANGGYSGQPAKVIMVVARKNMLEPIMSIIRQEDPQAFVSQGLVHGVYGEGFDPIKRKK